MPIIRVENWLSDGWKHQVAPKILAACLAAEVPGIDRDATKITVVFGGEMILRNHRKVAVIVEGLFRRTDRSKRVRDRLARSIGDAVKATLPRGFVVEVLVTRFDPKTDSFYEV